MVIINDEIYKCLPLHYKNRKEALHRDPENKTHNE